MKEAANMPATYRMTDLASPYLLDSSDISFRAKNLYLLICRVMPRSIAHIASLSGIDRDVIERECAELKGKGWVKFDILKSRPTIITPTAPDEVQDELIKVLKQDKAYWYPLGERIMKAMLDNTVASSNYLDNCRPDYVANPATGYRLEFDRLYGWSVAFEFQGVQHRRLTSLHASGKEFEDAQTRDLVKIGLSTRHGIEVVEITEEDLRIDRMIARIPESLPLLRIDRAAKFIRYLDRLGFSYLSYCKRKRTQDAKHAKS
jgi:hypothetical protein